MGGFYGNLAGESQTVPRAELVAIARALAVAKKPFRIVSEHLNHVEAIGKGQAWCLDVMGPMRDLWGRSGISSKAMGVCQMKLPSSGSCRTCPSRCSSRFIGCSLPQNKRPRIGVGP